LTRVPCAGSIARGVEISTPAMGPATDGLRGVSLFSTPHPTATAITAEEARRERTGVRSMA
jgi:hypothetical protein